MDTSSGKPKGEEMVEEEKTFRSFCAELLALDMAYEAARAGERGIEMSMVAEKLKNRVLRGLDLPGKTRKSVPAEIKPL